MFIGMLPNFDRKQAGDPAKLAKVVVDMVRGEGVAEGRTVPEKMPFGKDAIMEARQHAEGLLRVCKEWEGVVGGVMDVEE